MKKTVDARIELLRKNKKIYAYAIIQAEDISDELFGSWDANIIEIKKHGSKNRRWFKNEKL